ncbi:MAG: hypothetical protein M5U28_21965 [Sandaracinaceae bacterium]|nr:hypothetical protein [Sandaracinaceae bacterium]
MTAGLVALDGGSLEAGDMAVLDTRFDPAAGGAAVSAQTGGSIVLERGLVERSDVAALFAIRPGSRLEVSDVLVRDVRSVPSALVAGYGVHALRGGVVTASRLVIEGARESGVSAFHAGTQVLMTDLVVRGVTGRERDGALGPGVAIEEAATAVLTRARVEDVRFAAVYARTAASIEAVDLLVEGVRPAACAGTTCGEDGGGHGLVAYLDGASIAAERFFVGGTEVCGVLVGDGASVDFANGEVTRAPIGVCMQAEGYDLSRLTEGVRFAGRRRAAPSDVVRPPRRAHSDRSVTWRPSHRRARRAALAVYALGVAGCGGAPAADAGTDAPARVDAGPPQAPADPDIPWLAERVPPIEPPRFVPCPPGWREVADAGEPARCDPYPERGARTDCPAGEAHFPASRAAPRSPARARGRMARAYGGADAARAGGRTSGW